ncbi:MAG: lysophospholipid acyltransferase family protein [Terriglobia bacterium]
MIRTLLVLVVVFGYALGVGSICALIARFRGDPHLLYQAGRWIIGVGLQLAGIQIKLSGKENILPGQNFIFLANHQSYCDPPALVYSIPLDVRLILKKELRRLPLIGYILHLGGFVFIDRKDRRQSVEAMKQAVRQLASKESFLIYPEGTRTRTGKMGPFKKGPFMMAIESGVPIIPISVSGSYLIMPPHRFKITPGKISIRFHPSIQTKGLSLADRGTLTEQIWNTIASGLANSEYDSFAQVTQSAPESQKT